MEISSSKSLPENAYRSLKPGESYTPIVPAGSQMQEFTPRSVTLGILMAVLFSAAAAFLGLKVGQVFEAAIPISILAVGLGLAFKRRSTILENVIVQSVGAASGLVVAGVDLHAPGALHPRPRRQPREALPRGGLRRRRSASLFLVPLRRYFVKEMHGEFPFPEATATTEVLVAGEAGGAAGQGPRPRPRPSAASSTSSSSTSRRSPRSSRRARSRSSKDLAEQGEARLQARRPRLGRGARLHHRPEVLGDHLRRVVPLLVPPRSARGALRAVPDGRDPAGVRRHAHLHDERRGDLPRTT